MVQLFVPTDVGEKRTVTSTASSVPKENSPRPETMVNSGQDSEIVPETVPAPKFSIVKVRSDDSPTATSPKSRLDLSSRGTGGSVPFSFAHPPSSRVAARRRVRARTARLEGPWIFGMMEAPLAE
jgi:hypothetical protein